MSKVPEGFEKEALAGIAEATANGVEFDFGVQVSFKWVKEVLLKVRATARRVAKSLKTSVTLFLYKQIWIGQDVEALARKAIDRVRRGRPLKAKSLAGVFGWLCRKVDRTKLVSLSKKLPPPPEEVALAIKMRSLAPMRKWWGTRQYYLGR